MEQKVLTIGFVPLKNDQVRACTRIRVYFYLSSDFATCPRRFAPDEPGWNYRDSDKNLSYTNTNDLFNDLLKLKVEGKVLPEFVFYEGISYWQFLPSFIWPSFFLSVELIRTLQPLLKEFIPRDIRIFPVEGAEAHIWSGTVKAIGRAYKARVHFLRGKVKPIGRIKSFLRSQGVGFFVYRLINSVADRFLWLLSVKNKKPDFNRKLLFMTLGRHWVNEPGQNGKKYDEQFFPLLPALRSCGWTDFAAIDCPYGSPGQVISKLWDRFKQPEQGVAWKGFYGYGNIFYLEKKFIQAKVFFRKRYRLLRNSASFVDGFTYNTISLMPALDRELAFAFSVLIPECVYSTETARTILRQESPLAVAMTYETGPFQRAFVIQAARLNIPSIGLQHGAIFDNHYDYMHDLITNDPAKYPYDFAVPRKTCVWGPLWKRNLTEYGHYRSDSVEVTGNCRLDCFTSLQEHISPEGVKNRIGIDRSKKVVLVLTAGQRVSEFLETCLDATAGLVCIIKLHAADNPEPVRQLLKRKQRGDVVLISGDLYEFLSVADAVISQPSTAVAEAVLFNKPVILANFENQEGNETYAESGACLYATSPQGLKDALALVMNNSMIREKLRGMRNRFIEDYFFKIDGCSAQRISKVIAQWIP